MNVIESGPLADQLVALRLKIVEQDNKLDELLALLRVLLDTPPNPARRPIGFVVNS